MFSFLFLPILKGQVLQEIPTNLIRKGGLSFIDMDYSIVRARRDPASSFCRYKQESNISWLVVTEFGLEAPLPFQILSFITFYGETVLPLVDLTDGLKLQMIFR